TADVAYPPAPTHFPGLRGAIYVLLGTQIVLQLALFVFTALSMRGRRMTATSEQDEGYRPTPGRFSAPFVALIGWLIGGRPSGRAKQVASSRAWASLTDLAAPIVAGLALFTVVVMMALAAWYLSASGGFGVLPAYSPALTNASVFITVSLAMSLVLFAVQSF